ncbi:MAG: alpha/beta fold hydrolase [Bacteroidota bacterium]
MIATGNDIEVKINDAEICYDDFGESSIPLIFIHGFPFNKASWQPQMDFLKSSHRVIAYDIRGFGKSTSGDEKPSINLFADDLIQMMDVLQIKKAIVCGLSMGGYILLNAINRYPERFHAIILSDTQCIGDSAEAKEKRYKTIQQIETAGLTDFAAGFIKNVFCQESLNNKKDLVEEIKNMILSTNVEAVTGTLAALAQRQEKCFSLNEISIPALILCGKEDIVTPPVQSEFLHAHIKNSKFHSLDKAGHMANLEQADEFNKFVNDFIANL